MKHRIATLLLVASASAALAQGPLDPAGAPEPTMKTLDQIEPRTPITNLPWTISQPGSYYLTGNFTSAFNGIAVNADDVWIDLTGFTITGPGSWSGIEMGSYGSARRRVTIVHGTISGFDYGVRGGALQDCRFENLVISSNDFDGMSFVAAWEDMSGTIFRNCRVSQSGNYGISFNVTDAAFRGNLIQDCIINETAYSGIRVTGGALDFSGNEISGCLIAATGDEGISLTGAGTGNTITHNTIAAGGTAINVSSSSGHRIEDNHLSTASGGYCVDITGFSSNNFIFGNSCISSNGYYLDEDDVYGPIVTNRGALPATGAAAHPRANFWRN